MDYDQQGETSTGSNEMMLDNDPLDEVFVLDPAHVQLFQLLMAWHEQADLWG